MPDKPTEFSLKIQLYYEFTVEINVKMYSSLVSIVHLA